MLFQKKITCITHNGIFHTDDVFSAALLQIVFGKRVTFVRTRDEKLIQEAEYVFDVGGIYNVEKNRYDHHQIGGAGKRENGIPYASFGLLWKKFGEEVCGGKQVAGVLDEKLVTPIDALDNGVEISAQVLSGVSSYSLNDVISSFRPTWKENEDTLDARFLDAVSLAKTLLLREIKKTQDKVEALSFVEKVYSASEDKRLIIFDTKYPWADVIKKYSEPQYVVYPNGDKWHVSTVGLGETGFQNRKDFPKAWAGKRDAELAAVTGVPDAIFCHNGLFLAVARSREGALALAELALKS